MEARQAMYIHYSAIGDAKQMYTRSEDMAHGSAYGYLYVNK